MTIHERRDGQPAGSVWGIAMSTAMGSGILPRQSTERVSDRAERRWPWSRRRGDGVSLAATPRG